MSDHPFDFKGEMSLLNVLVLKCTDVQAVDAGLKEKGETAGSLLKNTPLIVDAGALKSAAKDLDFKALRTLLTDAGFMPVGMRHVDEQAQAAARAAGWILLPASRTSQQTAVKDEAAEIPVARQAAGVTGAAGALKLVERPVRSGQQVYNPDGDIVVLRHTSAASELLARGSVHVYGALRGRVLAGVQGDTTARIFCQQLEAELVSIAGCYRLLEEEDMPLKGQAVMISLQADKLMIEPMT